MTHNRAPIVIVGAGQSGLTAARAARDAGATPIVLETGPRASGSWSHYYESLRVFSPARFSAIPGYQPIAADPDSYPGRDSVADYLEGFADSLDVEIRTGTHVTSVTAADNGYFVHTASGQTITAGAVVAASGSFGNPRLPALPGQGEFIGEIVHVADYRRPDEYRDQRIIVVGGGNSAVQVGHELSRVATVTLAVNRPIKLVDQRCCGRDLHHLLVSGFDHLPSEWIAPFMSSPLTIDVGGYREALRVGDFDQQPMFTAFEGDSVVWSDGRRERVDTVLFATGYRPNLAYLSTLGAVDAQGRPRHRGGISTSHPGLAYVGLEFQRRFASNTLRGVDSDARFVMPPLLAYADGLHAAFR